jgi:hypothetical protein
MKQSLRVFNWSAIGDPCAAPPPPLPLHGAICKFGWRGGVPYIFGRRRRPTNSAARWNFLAQSQRRTEGAAAPGAGWGWAPKWASKHKKKTKRQDFFVRRVPAGSMYAACRPTLFTPEGVSACVSARVFYIILSSVAYWNWKLVVRSRTFA